MLSPFYIAGRAQFLMSSFFERRSNEIHEENKSRFDNHCARSGRHNGIGKV